MRTRAFGLVALALAFSSVTAFGDATIDVTKAVKVTLPNAGDTPVAFKTPDGKAGWVRRLSNETIPTVAYAKGRIFTGAGMRSRAFYALDAATGKTLWQQTTQDNGPTSAVVEDKYVCYNTESCHTETRDIDSGGLIWSELTGGTLLTQPVIANGLLVIPHPTIERRSVMADDSFRMLGTDLKTGQHRFDANMTADVLAAPVAAGTRVYFTCTDGRVFCFDTKTGGGGWHIKVDATSAPVVVGDVLAVTTEEKTNRGAAVSIRRYSTADGEELDGKPLATTITGRPVLTSHQRAEWDYQGPKIAAAGTRLFNAPGQVINSVDIKTGATYWRASVTGGGLGNGANTLTPPALGQKNLYLGTAKGQVLAVSQADGALAFAYDLGQPLASQFVLADGNLYIGTANGLLVCLQVQNSDAEGWHAWGGDAQHNKVQ